MYHIQEIIMSCQ